MKKKDIGISLAIIACSASLVYYYTQGKGYIEIDTGGVDATLQLRNSFLGHVTVHSGVEPAEARAIIHRPRHLKMEIKRDGHNYQIDSDGPWGSLSKINLNKNKTTLLRFGPPFVIKPDVHNKGNHISIDFSILGQAGEQYRKYALKNNRRISGAKLKIIDEEGNVLENGKFRYG